MDTKSGAWTNITPRKPNQDGEAGYGYAGLALDARNPGTLMVSTMDRWAAHDEIYRSRDGGATWRPLGPNSTRDASSAPFLNGGDGKAALGHWIGDIDIDPFNADHVLYVTGATIWGSDNVRAMDANRTTQWTPRAHGIEETAVLDLISPPGGAPLIRGMGDIGGFRHNDLTVAPHNSPPPSPGMSGTTSLDFAGSNPDLMARAGNTWSGQRGAGFSLDGAATWAAFAGEPSEKAGGGTVAISSDGATIIWTPNDGFAAVSRDRGATWTRSAGLPQKAHVVADRADAATFYAFDPQTGTLLASVDGGATFAARATNLPKSGGKLRAVSARKGDLWLMLGGKGLHHSTDGGATWTSIPTIAYAQSLGLGKAAPNRTYPALYLVGTINGVEGIFRSDDTGATWTRINDDAHQWGASGHAITGDPRVYGRVYIGTNGRGIQWGDIAPALRK